MQTRPESSSVSGASGHNHRPTDMTSRFHEVVDFDWLRRVLAERATKSKDAEGCWLWLGVRGPNYGTIDIPVERGPGKHPYMRMLAHRAAYYEAHRDHVDPETFDRSVVMHSCNEPRCVRPSHLVLGTQRSNIRQAARQGRFPARKGRPQRRAPEDALLLAAALAWKGVGLVIVSRLTGLTRTTAWKVGRGLHKRACRVVSAASEERIDEVWEHATRLLHLYRHPVVVRHGDAVPPGTPLVAGAIIRHAQVQAIVGEHVVGCS